MTTTLIDEQLFRGRTSGAIRREPLSRSIGESWGWLPALSLSASVGLVLLAVADNASRGSEGWSGKVYWLAVATIFVPIAWRLFSQKCERLERIGLVVILGLSFYLLKVMAWPLGFAFHDELGQLRTSLDIAQTHHLFSTNPVVPAYSYYPGLEIVTNALSAGLGITPAVAGFVVIGVARVILMISLFRLFELAGGSSRAAGIAVLFYAANPNFVYFDAQVAYESLALPLIVLVLFGVARRSFIVDTSRPRRAARGMALVLTLCISAAVVTHHVSVYFLAIALLTWAIFGRVRALSTAQPQGSWLLAAITCIAAGGWYAFAGPATESELKSVPVGAFSSVWALIAGESGPRQLFHAQNGVAEALAAQVLGFASVALILVGLPLGLRLIARHRNPLSMVLLALALLYPLTLVLRLTSAGTETSSRASEYVFLGVAFALALMVTEGPLDAIPGSLRSIRARLGRLAAVPLLGRTAFAAYASVIFVGGLIVGWPPSARLPATFQVGEPPRSIGPEGVEMARWAGDALPPGHVAIGDMSNALLLASYGRQSPASEFIAGFPLLDLYRSRSITAVDRRMLVSARYLVVDERLSTTLPLNGYFGKYDFNYGLTRPLPLSGLRKFDHDQSLSRIYDSGNISIYRRGAASR